MNIVGFFGEERRPPAQDVGANQIFHRIQQTGLANHVAQPGEGQMGLDAEPLRRRFADGILQRCIFGAEHGGVVLGIHIERG